MNFLHAPWLLGLIGLAVPIVLHLQRKRTRTLDWAAMRFLQKSMANRRRGLTLEHLLLLACRCLLVATFVVAMAHPWSAYPHQFLTLLVIALAVVSVIGLAWAVVSPVEMRLRCLVGAAGMLLIALATAIAWSSGRTLTNSGPVPLDVVFIIDSSDSMSLGSTKRKSQTYIDDASSQEGVKAEHFERALDEAESLLNKLPSGSTAALLIAGPETMPRTLTLQRNLQAVREQMRTREHVNCNFNLSQEIERARSLLKQGDNAEQQIVLFTDDQWTNWQSLQDLAIQNESPEVGESLVGRVFPLPEARVNLAVTKLEIDERPLRSGDRTRLQVEVLNGGTDLVDSASVDILLNDVVVQTRALSRLAPGLSQNITFDFTFEKAGPQVVSARINFADDIAGDDRFDRALVVYPPVAVLVMNGSLSSSPSRRSSTYVQLALSGLSTTIETIDAGDLQALTDLDRYEIIILCDVPQLPDAIADSVSQYVFRGGGLMMLMGVGCDPNFYNDWRLDGKPLLPLPLNMLRSRQSADIEMIQVDITSFTHHALSKLVESGEHDFTDWTATDYWYLGEEQESSSSVGVRFNNGDPLLVEHQHGRGRVLLQTTAPAPRQNNFISRVSFPVWMHLLTRDLADSHQTRLHQKTSSNWTIELPVQLPAGQSPQPDASVAFNLRTVGGNQREVFGSRVDSSWVVELGAGDVAGHYVLSGPIETKLGAGPFPLTIERSAGEADLSIVTPDIMRALAQQIGMTLVQDDAQMVPSAGVAPGVFQWWRHFALAALLLVAVESILLMWVRGRRRVKDDNSQPYSRRFRLLTLLWVVMVWAATWLFWTQGWRVAGQITQSQFGQSATWLGSLVATLSCVIVWTYTDRRWLWSFESSTLMKSARMLLIGLLGFVLLEPTRSGETETGQQRQVIVLWDRSDSMHLPVGGALGKSDRNVESPDRAVQDETTFDSDAGLGVVASRESVASKLLWSGYHNQSPLVSELQKDFQLSLYEFASTPRLVIDPKRDPEPPLDRWSKATDLTAALQRSLADVPASELSGVIVLTDGCDRSNLPNNAVVAGLGRNNIPIHSIVIGDQTPVKDIEVVMVQATSQVLVGDRVTVRATIKADRLSGHTATVRFLRDGEVLQTQLLDVPSDHFRTVLQFADQPQQKAHHQYAVEVESLEDEAILQNNRSMASVWVTTDRTRLLVIEQRPRWEFRYLKNLFAGRDRNVALQYVLLSPDRLAGVPEPYPMTASASRAFDDCEANRLPESEQEWLKFDVIVLGDVAPDELDEGTLQILEKFVRVRGGTLVVIAGQDSMPHRYLNTPLADLLPIQDSTAAIPPSRSGYRLRLTDEGTNSALMQNPVGDSNSVSVWDSLPRMYWRHSLASAKPGATVLAWADDSPDPPDPAVADRSDASVRNRQHALILWHRFGGGRVLQMNFDQTWRLRFWNGDEHHHQFWGRVMRWATEDRLGMGTDLVRLGIDRADYKPGDVMNVKVRLVDDQLASDGETGARVLLYREDELVQDVALQEVADSGGLLQAKVILPDQSGRYRLQVDGPIVDQLLAIESQQSQSVFAEFTVASAIGEGELQDVVASTAVVSPLAKMTGGQVLVPETADELLDHLGPKSLYRLDRWTVPLWNSWPVVTLFFLLLGGEWIARRWCGLI